MNPLLVYFQAKDIPEVLEELYEIDNIDIMCLKYMPFPIPHKVAFDYLIMNPQYTHIIIQPVDLIVTKEHIEKLLQRVQGHYVYSGVCNVDLEKYKDYLACSYHLPDKDPNLRRAYWISKNKNQEPFRVAHVGFSLTCISRKVIEDIYRHKLPLYQKDSLQHCADLAFSHACKELDYPIICDPDINMKHLRFQGKNLCGTRNQAIEFIFKEDNK